MTVKAQRLRAAIDLDLLNGQRIDRHAVVLAESSMSAELLSRSKRLVRIDITSPRCRPAEKRR